MCIRLKLFSLTLGLNFMIQLQIIYQFQSQKYYRPQLLIENNLHYQTKDIGLMETQQNEPMVSQPPKQQQFHRRRLILLPSNSSTNQSPMHANQVPQNSEGAILAGAANTHFSQDQQDQAVSKFQNIIKQVNISDLKVGSQQTFMNGGGQESNKALIHSNHVISGELQLQKISSNNQRQAPSHKDIQSLTQGVSSMNDGTDQQQLWIGGQANNQTRGEPHQQYSNHQPIYIMRQSIGSIKELGSSTSQGMMASHQQQLNFTSAPPFQEIKISEEQNKQFHQNEGRPSMGPLSLAQYKQHSEPLNSQTQIRPSQSNMIVINTINTERSIPFNGNSQNGGNIFWPPPSHISSQSGPAIAVGIQGQYARPKTNSPFPPFSNNVRNSGGSGQISQRGSNAGLQEQRPSLVKTQFEDSQKLHLMSPNAHMLEPALGSSQFISQANFNGGDESTQYQSRRYPELESMQTQNEQQMFPANFGNRSFHKRQHSRQILASNPLAEVTGLTGAPTNGQSNFNIGGTWSSAAIMLNNSIGSTSQQLSSNSPQTQSRVGNDFQQNFLLHQLNEATISPKQQTNEKSSQLIKEVNYCYQNEQEASDGKNNEPRQFFISSDNYQRPSLRLQKAASNSESKPKRRSPPPNDVSSVQTNPQMQQSQQVFMQNNFFIQQMLASPLNNQIRLKGANNTDVPMNELNQGFGPIPFDASLSGAHGNPFFDLMEMSSVLSSTLLGGDPLVDSANSGMLPPSATYQLPGELILHHNNSTDHPTGYYPQQAALFQSNQQQYYQHQYNNPQMINVPHLQQNINNNLRIIHKQHSHLNQHSPDPLDESSGLDSNQERNQHEGGMSQKVVISRKSTASRVRLNRLNKMIGAASASQQSSFLMRQRDEVGGTVVNSENLNQSQLSGSVQGVAPPSSQQYKSYQSESSQKQSELPNSQNPIWIQSTPQASEQNEVTQQKRQKIQLLNKSFRDLPNAFQNTLLSQSAIQKAHEQTPIATAQLDLPQEPQGLVTDFVDNLRIDQHSPLDTSMSSSMKGDVPKRCNSSIIAPSNEALNNQLQNKGSYMYESKFGISQVPSDDMQQHPGGQTDPNTHPIQQSPQQQQVDNQSDRYSSQNSRKSATSNTFCIEMGKAKPKILKNSFSSAYKVFMPNNESSNVAPGTAGHRFSRRSNHRLFREPDYQGQQFQEKQLMTEKNPVGHTDNNSLERQPQHLLTNTKSSFQRETLVTHSQRANEFSPTNPSYYITFNQDSNEEHQKFNSEQYQQRLPSSHSSKNGAEGSSDGKANKGEGKRMHRSDSKASSSSRHNHRSNVQIERNAQQMIQSTNQRIENGSYNQKEFMIQSANIMGLNRKIKVNRLANRNIIQNNLQNLSSQLHAYQETGPKDEPGFGLRKNSRVAEQAQKAQCHRSRMSSFDNPPNLSQQNTQIGPSSSSFLPQFKVTGGHSATQVNEDEDPLMRHTQSQAYEPLHQSHSKKQIFSSASRGQLTTQPMIMGSGNTTNLLEQNSVSSNGHFRRQSQQLVPIHQKPSQSNMLLPPRHKPHQRTNTLSQKRDDKVFSQQTFNLLGQSQSKLRLQEDSLQKQPSLGRLDFPQTDGIGNFRTSQGTPMMNQTASFMPQEKSLVANSSQVSLQRRSTKQLLAQQMLASTYQVSQLNKEVPNTASYQHNHGNMSARRRRAIQQKDEPTFEQYFISNQESIPKSTLPQSSTATFSQLVLEQKQYYDDKNNNQIAQIPFKNNY